MDGAPSRTSQPLLTAGFILLAACLTACAGRPEPTLTEPSPIDQRQAALRPVYDAYNEGDYARAYQLAVPLTRKPDRSLAAEAAYMAGLSAYQQGQPDAAVRHLDTARQAGDIQLAADAAATLGSIYIQAKRYDLAEQALLEAARRYTGEASARAYLHAGIAQQHQQKWAPARTSFVLARQQAFDAALREQIDLYLQQSEPATAYTLQVGLYNRRSNADAAVERYTALAKLYQLQPPRLLDTIQPTGDVLYRVYVGRFDSFQQAADFQRKANWPNARIVPAP